MPPAPETRVEGLLAQIVGGFPAVESSLTDVGTTLPLVGHPLSFVSLGVAPVCDLIPLISRPFPFVRGSIALAGALITMLTGPRTVVGASGAPTLLTRVRDRMAHGPRP